MAAFFGGNKFAPGNGFGVGAAAKAAPVNGLGTDANSVGITLQGNFFVTTAGHQFRINAELLGPVARNAAANGEDAHFFGGHHGVGEVFEILEGIEAEEGLAIALAAEFVESKIEAEFRIAEGGNENGNVVFICGFEDAAALGVF